MKSIKRKLNSKTGASILIVMVGFMLAAMVSIVIISAAVSSAKRVANDKKTNQANLTLESAAQLIRDEMEDTVCTITVTTNDENVTTTDYSGSGTFGDEMKAATKIVDSGSGTKYYSKDHSANFTISLNSGSADVSTVETVSVSYVMNYESSTDEGSKYDMVFTFELNGQEVYLTMVGSRESVSEFVDEVTWSAVSINQFGVQNETTTTQN